MRVLVCPDKFRGTLSAPRAAEAIARGWGGARPDDQRPADAAGGRRGGTLDVLMPDAALRSRDPAASLGG
jgi:Glycerate kinase